MYIGQAKSGQFLSSYVGNWHAHIDTHPVVIAHSAAKHGNTRGSGACSSGKFEETDALRLNLGDLAS